MMMVMMEVEEWGRYCPSYLTGTNCGEGKDLFDAQQSLL